MDFRLDAQTVKWRQVAREFADEVVRPVAAELDARTDPAEAWSWELIDEASRRGLRQAPAPPEFGGDETSFLTDVVMLEEIAAADVGAAVAIAQHWRFLHMLLELGTPEQRERWGRRIAENPRSLMAAAMTEPDAASDNILPHPAPGAGMTSRAERRDGGYVLNGMKHFISNGNRADVMITFFRTDPDGPLTSSVSAFVVAADTPGVSIGRVHDKIGERLANNSEIFWRDVFVPEEDRLGDEGQAMQNVAKLLRGSNAYASACALGIARECYDRTVKFCRERVQGGKPIVEHETIASHLVDMYVDIDVTRTYIYRASWQAIDPDGFDTKLGIAPKLVASERTFEAARRAMELWGGRGVMKENGIEKLLRDAAIWLHSDGTNVVMRAKLANQLRAGDDGPALWDRFPAEAA